MVVQPKQQSIFLLRDNNPLSATSGTECSSFGWLCRRYRITCIGRISCITDFPWWMVPKILQLVVRHCPNAEGRQSSSASCRLGCRQTTWKGWWLFLSRRDLELLSRPASIKAVIPAPQFVPGHQRFVDSQVNITGQSTVKNPMSRITIASHSKPSVGDIITSNPHSPTFHLTVPSLPA